MAVSKSANNISHLPSIIVSALIATLIAAIMSTSKPSGPFERITSGDVE